MIPGWRFSHNYQFVRPEKNTKYARGTYTLDLKKKILKNVQSLKYVGVFQSSSSIVLRVRCVCQFINSAVILPNAPHCILHQTRESFLCHKILNHCAIAAFIDFCTISPEKKSIYGAYAMYDLVLFFSLS
jgi:hypothetical protein